MINITVIPGSFLHKVYLAYLEVINFKYWNNKIHYYNILFCITYKNTNKQDFLQTINSRISVHVTKAVVLITASELVYAALDLTSLISGLHQI